MALTHIHERFIGGDVVDSVRCRLANGKAGKVIGIDRDRCLGLSPTSTFVKKVAYEFFFLRADRNRRLTCVLKAFPLAGNKLKPGVPIGMIGFALVHLAGALEAIARFFEQFAHGAFTHGMPLSA